MLVNTRDITENVYKILNKINGLTVTLSQPETTMSFPIAVITPPVENNYPHQQYVIIRITIEAWNDSRYSTMDVFDSIKEIMYENDINLRSSTVIFQDAVTQKYRISGNFECRFNCITNSIERNF